MDDPEVKSEEGASQPREGSNSDTPKPKRPSQACSMKKMSSKLDDLKIIHHNS